MTIINAYWTGVITQTGIMMIAIIGISLLTGFTGIFSMGHAGFMCIGGYVSALLVKSVGLPIWAGIIGGMLASMLFGLIIAIPTMKMDGDYFLIASIGIGEAVRLLVENTYNLTGGSTGMMDIGRINSLGLVLLLDVVVILFAVFFLRSKYGRNCIAVRDNEVAATAMGIDVYRTKIIVFVISCAIVALSGALLGHYLNYINPRIDYDSYHGRSGFALRFYYCRFDPDAIAGTAAYRVRTGMAYGDIRRPDRSGDHVPS